jgi:cob(I)alamin adenosyltransferase
MEEMIDLVSAELVPLNNFILPGGTPESAWLHLVRSLCRKAERDCVLIQEVEDDLDPKVLVYLNRLSDLLFVLARKHNDKGKKDHLWRKEGALSGE